MGRPYSQDLRARVLAASHAGQSHLAVAARFAVGESTVRSWRRCERQTGRTTPLPHLGGLTLAGLTACMSIEGAADTAVMVAFVKQVLVPTLTPGQVVVLDNLSVHRAHRVRQLIEHAGCELRFLPPYPPDFNPIEPAWSKLKTLLRGVGARTTAALHDALAGVVEAITPDDARGYFHHCGYGRSATP